MGVEGRLSSVYVGASEYSLGMEMLVVVEVGIDNSFGVDVIVLVIVEVFV